MKISFFEEFPSKENLSKLRLVKANSVYIASHGIYEFNSIKKRIKTKAVYWPVLRKEDGYWISPFSNSAALKRIFSEIPKNQEVMLDLEIPLNWLLIIKNMIYFFKNKKIIREFIKSHKAILCESVFPSNILRIFGLSYNARKINMAYTSMNHFINLKKIHADKIGIGCIAKGIYGNETIMKPKELENDLRILEKAGKEAIIFRLGGLNKEYLNVIRKFT